VKERTATEREIIRESVKTLASSEETRLNGKPAVRYASDEQFRKAQEKTSKDHAGLFRRLAQ
jgi:hypothetical protein